MKKKELIKAKEFLALYEVYNKQANQEKLDCNCYHSNGHDNSGGHPNYHNNSHDNTPGKIKIMRL